MLPSVSVLDFRFSGKLHQIGVSPTGHLTIGLPGAGELRDWEGREIETPEMLSFGAGCEFDCVSESGFSGSTVSIALDHLSDVASKTKLDVSEAVFGTFLKPVIADRQLYSETCQVLRALPEGGTPDWLQDDLTSNLLTLLTSASPSSDTSTPRQRARAVSIALDCMAENDEDILPMTRICDETGVSLRCLQRGFKERFGLGPKSYYTRLRLNRVRSALHAGGPRGSVVDAANAFGFWHMGQFAKDYRGLFGELPSSTLQQMG